MKLYNKVKNYYKRAYKNKHYPTMYKLLFSNKKVFAYFGFLGDNNFGDELVFESAKNLFYPYILLPILRWKPISILLLQKLSIIKISGIVIGGGTLIGSRFEEEQAFEKLIQKSIPIYLHGTGVNVKKTIHETWLKILKSNYFGGVRGPLSAQYLNNMYKTKSKVVGDAAFSLFNQPQQTTQHKNGNNILINIGTHLPYENENISRLECHHFIEVMTNQGYNIQFLPCYESDIKFGTQLQERFPNIKILNIPTCLDEAINEFKECTFAIGERLHFVAVALMVGCPIFSINYSNKHIDLLASLNSVELGVEPLKCTYENIYIAFNNRDKIDWNNINLNLSTYQKSQKDEYNEFIKEAFANDFTNFNI